MSYIRAINEDHGLNICHGCQKVIYPFDKVNDPAYHEPDCLGVCDITFCRDHLLTWPTGPVKVHDWHANVKRAKSGGLVVEVRKTFSGPTSHCDLLLIVTEGRGYDQGTHRSVKDPKWTYPYKTTEGVLVHLSLNGALQTSDLSLFGEIDRVVLEARRAILGG